MAYLPSFLLSGKPGLVHVEEAPVAKIAFLPSFIVLRLKFQVQHPEPEGRRMLRWTDEASISAARSAA
jgi:hypothetical protein